MVDGITGAKALPAEVLERIVERTDGVPLFVEELTKTVLESGTRHCGRPLRACGTAPASGDPGDAETRSWLCLDRLGAVRQVAQIGAVIGREFSYKLLEAIAPSAGAELTAILDQLVAAELIFQRGVPPGELSVRARPDPGGGVSFVAKDRRQRLHALVAQALEERVPGARQEEPEVLAHHLTEAGLFEPAIGYWHEAGRRAAQRSANKEALDHLHRALSLLRLQPDARERRVHELALLNILGPVLLAAKGFADQVVAETYHRGRELCQEVGDAAQLVTVLRGLWAFHLVRAELDASRGRNGANFTG